ncbi:Putative SOS response-associated peptidase YedK [Marivirga sericea]|uniref:Abasic site processing protein n=1 Tax=Marivirga sericea TaxID=1028 RepID=A0A1X7IL35_9BACT|nr:SOS response-associated peptidase [Marivirga sericea]SMG15671.1 Putative SOS response-associated peptidase YedK [Marivirga sericea]
MCYDISSFIQKKKKYTQRHPDKNMSALENLFNEKGEPVQPIFHTTGFDHPKLAVITNKNPDEFTLFQWGLIPFWTKDSEQAEDIQNKTINARGESIFEKPAFRKAAADRRCIIMVDGFFEHQHQKKQLIPYYISLKDQSPISLAGIWEEWENPDDGQKISTVSVVTTTANSLMAEIHNNPKLKEPRMPLILHQELESEWLLDMKDKISEEQVKALIQPFDENLMNAWPVKPIRGRKNKSQSAALLEKHEYGQQLGLF